jgi:hypothetical protein
MTGGRGRANVRMCIDHGHRAIGNRGDGWQSQTAKGPDPQQAIYIKNSKPSFIPSFFEIKELAGA